MPGSLEHASDIYDQLIDGDISEQDGGYVEEEVTNFEPNLKSDHQLLVLEKIDEELQSEDSEAIYR
jgi:GTPase involved in cell partitioning and DNA repair